MRVKLLGLYWTLVFENLWRYRTADGERVDGLCDPPNAPNRTIHIDCNLTGKAKLEAVIHECTHGGDPTKKEEWVEEFAHDLTNILWRLGYREVKRPS